MKIVESKIISITKGEVYSKDLLRTSFLRMLEMRQGQSEIIAAEIGVWEGVNSKFMLFECPVLKLHLVDAWDNVVVYTGGPLQSKEYCDLIKNNAMLNLKPESDRVIFTYKNSQDAVKDYKNDFFDYVYIDGDHEHDAVKLDLESWWPKVKTGGVLGGHDVVMEGVSTALDEFVKKKKIVRWAKETNIPGKSDFWIYK